jgi:TPR repeat protein
MQNDEKFTADQETAAENNRGFSLQNGDGVSLDLRGAAHYHKLAADQGVWCHNLRRLHFVTFAVKKLD